MNTLTIEFKGPKDLAKKIAEYNELVNGKPEPTSIEHKEPVNDVKVEKEVVDVPITDFDGNEINQPTEELSIDEVEVFDAKEFWNEFKTWMGSDKERAMSALKIFQNNGVAKPTSTALTDVIVKELKELMK